MISKESIGDPDAKEVWDTLEQEFVDGVESASLDPTELYKEYNNITQKYDESPLMYYARKNRYRRLLDRNGREILDEFFIRDLIAGLTRGGRCGYDEVVRQLTVKMLPRAEARKKRPR